MREIIHKFQTNMQKRLRLLLESITRTLMYSPEKDKMALICVPITEANVEEAKAAIAGGNLERILEEVSL